MPDDGRHDSRATSNTATQPRWTHPLGHNLPGGDGRHLHSHPHAHPEAPDPSRPKADDEPLLNAFIAGFEGAADKTSFLRVARVPFELAVGKGRPTLKLVDVEIKNGFQVGTASPAFGSRDLVYHPYPGNMVRARTTMTFVYVSLDERREVGLAEMVKLMEK
jgi:hypothetical protein